jgi:hypothetical protein
MVVQISSRPLILFHPLCRIIGGIQTTVDSTVLSLTVCVCFQVCLTSAYLSFSPSGMDSLTSLGSFSNSRNAKKVFNLSDIYLWQNYLTFACTVHPVFTIEQVPCDNDNG